MSSVYESGHAKNAANLQKLIQIVTTFGATYNPSNANITISALNTLYANANTKIDAVTNALNTWKLETNNRAEAFEAATRISTQLLAALESNNVTEETINDFSALVKKMRGDRNSKLTKADAGKLANPELSIPETTSVSTSQQSFDNKIQHFNKMIVLLQSQSNYAPNETALQVATLQTQLANLTTVNNAANTAYANLKAARIDRNTFFYGQTSSLLDNAKAVKAYVKGVYGAASQNYKAVNAVKFTRVVEKKKAA